jgi:hypothetical protein
VAAPVRRASDRGAGDRTLACRGAVSEAARTEATLSQGIARARPATQEHMTNPSGPGPATTRTLFGLLLVALSTLMYEVLLTRIFSVTMWYHFAFVAISVAMFGMTVGALLVYLRPAWFPEASTKTQLAVAGVLFPIVLVLSFLTQLAIPFRVHPSVVAMYAIVFTYAVIAAPFVVSGVAVCLALTRFPRDTGRLYAFDLAGAALGCVLLVAVLAFTDGPGAVLAVAALAALGGVLFAADGGTRRWRRIGMTSLVVLTVAAGAHAVSVWREFPVFRIIYVKAAFEARALYETWNSYSRVRVEGDPARWERPYAWGLSSTWPEDRRVQQLHMDIDVAAGTVLTKVTGDPRDLEHLKYDVTNIGYYAVPQADALVVGVGGGRDVLSALVFDAKSVTGVEINDAIVRAVTGRFGEFTGHLDRDPRVRFVSDEARSFVARQRQQFDVIQISLIDTWAATAAGAFVLSENSLYTVDGWRVFLGHLSDRGLLSVSRWYFRERPAEVYRLTSLAAATLKSMGVARPQQHMLIVRNANHGWEGEQPDGVGTMLVSRTPLSAEVVARIREAADRLRFEVVLAPDVAADETFTRLASGEDLDAFTRSYPINISAPTDDSPFFFNMLRLGDVLDLGLLRHGKSTHNMEAVLVLCVLLFTVILLTILCIVVPLWLTTDRGTLRGAGPLLAFFAAIGLGFMLVEISQMQRLIVMLGHPTYGLTVVLFSLLLSGGVGSWSTHHVEAAGAGRAGLVRLVALLVLLIAFGLATPWLIRLVESAPTAWQIVVAVAMLAPAGFLMGTAFPLGMKLAARHAPGLAPWLWGINGATSVCASVLAVAIALGASISAAFWTGAACYLAAAVALVAHNRGRHAPLVSGPVGVRS